MTERTVKKKIRYIAHGLREPLNAGGIYLKSDSLFFILIFLIRKLSYSFLHALLLFLNYDIKARPGI